MQARLTFFLYGGEGNEETAAQERSPTTLLDVSANGVARKWRGRAEL
jgi:hypothetical protein